MIGFRAVVIGVALLGVAIGTAQAQYYPPPGYPRPPGFRCEARVRTPVGPRSIICPIRAGRPVGAPCHCPPPPPPPGYALGAPLRGHVVP